MSNVALSKDAVLFKIQPYLLKHGYKFVKFVEPYRNSRDKITLQCPKHGAWSVSIRHVCSTDCGCPMCGRNNCSIKKSQDKSIVLNKIQEKCIQRGHSFKGFIGPYRNRKTKIQVECPKHGNYSININNFVDGNKNCRACSKNGFNTSKVGFLYALLSDSGEYIKIGITNVPQIRLKTLKRKTPFDFNLLELIKFDKGLHALTWESIFHEYFESANLTGFDGCTEWLKWSHSLIGWLRFINVR